MDASRSAEEHVPHPPGTNTVGFHRKQFLAERIGWGAMGLYLVWALAGGFGEGWLSDKVASNQSGSCTLDYQRFGRRDAPCELRIQLRLSESQERIALQLNQDFIERVKLEYITPAYQSMKRQDDNVTLFFASERDTEQTIIIEYTPKHAGLLPVSVRLAQDAEVVFDQFIYP